MISISGLVGAIICLLAVGFIFWLLQWGINRINPPEPWKKTAEVVLVLAAIFIIIGLILHFVLGVAIFKP